MFKESQMKCRMFKLSINYRQLAQTETSPLWALWVRGNDTTSLTYFRDLNYTRDRSSCDVWSSGNENLRVQTNKQQQPKLGHNFLCPWFFKCHPKYYKWKPRNSDVPWRHLAVEQAELHTAVSDWTTSYNCWGIIHMLIFFALWKITSF